MMLEGEGDRELRARPDHPAGADLDLALRVALAPWPWLCH
jgi:hypothetical protein